MVQDEQFRKNGMEESILFLPIPGFSKHRYERRLLNPGMEWNRSAEHSVTFQLFPKTFHLDFGVKNLENNRME